jgi:Fe-S-cluster containining protein
VPVSPPEAFYVTDVIDTLEPARRSEVLQRFDAIVKVLDEREMIERLLEPRPTEEPVLPIAREYFGLGLACPFLVDESCGIHEHRPVACRDYNVTSPAEWCTRPYDHDVAKVPMVLPLSAPLARLTATLTGEKPCLIPLTLVPRWVDAHRDLRLRQWPGPELFDRLEQELGRGGPDAPQPSE